MQRICHCGKYILSDPGWEIKRFRPLKPPVPLEDWQTENEVGERASENGKRNPKKRGVPNGELKGFSCFLTLLLFIINNKKLCRSKYDYVWFFVSKCHPVMKWQPVQGVPHLNPVWCWDRLQPLCCLRAVAQMVYWSSNEQKDPCSIADPAINRLNCPWARHWSPNCFWCCAISVWVSERPKLLMSRWHSAR